MTLTGFDIHNGYPVDIDLTRTSWKEVREVKKLIVHSNIKFAKVYIVVTNLKVKEIIKVPLTEDYRKKRQTHSST